MMIAFNIRELNDFMFKLKSLHIFAGYIRLNSIILVILAVEILRMTDELKNSVGSILWVFLRFN